MYKHLAVMSLLGILTSLGLAAESAAPRPAFTNQHGWAWHIKPADHYSIPGSSAGRGVVLRLDELKGEKVLLTLAYPEKLATEVMRFQPVAIKASGERFEFNPAEGGADA